MDEIEEVITEIVRGCKEKKVPCSQLLAAFVARTILESDSVEFALEKDLTDGDVNKVINLSIERLLERDSPSLETIRMQVAFDSSHVANDKALADSRSAALAKKREVSVQQQTPIVSPLIHSTLLV